MTGPELTIVVLTYNEAEHLDACMESLQANGIADEPWEVLFVDGGSTDGTREIIADYLGRLPDARLIDNPHKQKPHGLNLGIRAARGAYIMRIDAHSTYAPGYVRGCLAGFGDPVTRNVGGVRETHVPADGSTLAQALALAVSDPLVVGDAHYRTDRVSAPRFVDSVFCGCYPREVFETVGLFNEELVRTQDRELNLRLRRSGGQIMLDPAIRCTYYPRTDLRGYLRWNSVGAFWLGYGRRFTETPMLAARNFVPAAFAGYLAGWIVFWLLTLLFGPSTLLVGVGAAGSVPMLAYLGLGAAAGWRVSRQQGRPGHLVAFPVVVFLTHVSYGAALAWGWIRSVIDGRKVWEVEYLGD